MVDLGFRGVDADNPGKEIIHRGRYKSLSEQQKRWLKRRTAVEPAIGHLKSDYRMDRCWLQGALGDALHAISCAAGYNLRWLMRAIARLGIGIVFLRVLLAALTPTSTLHTAYATLKGTTRQLIEKFRISRGARKSQIQLTRPVWI